MNESKTKLEASLAELYKREVEYETACTNSATAEADYRIKFAEEFLKADGAAETRKQIATTKVKAQLKARFTNDAIRDFTREKLRDAQTACSLRQSMYSAENRSDFGHARRNDVP